MESTSKSIKKTKYSHELLRGLDYARRDTTATKKCWVVVLLLLLLLFDKFRPVRVQLF